ncbi:hypothetical protein V6238_17820 [Marinomonas arenicola]|uniref:hypothetical protein n=1 Tax=Marinomonas arenicola TaxID=569601 RepID=UPI00311E99BB
MEALRQNKAFSENDGKRGDIHGEESLYFIYPNGQILIESFSVALCCYLLILGVSLPASRLW